MNEPERRPGRSAVAHREAGAPRRGDHRTRPPL